MLKVRNLDGTFGTWEQKFREETFGIFITSIRNALRVYFFGTFFAEYPPYIKILVKKVKIPRFSGSSINLSSEVLRF